MAATALDDRHLGFQVKYCNDLFLNGTSVSAVPENPMIDTNICCLGAIGEELGGMAAILDFLISQGCSMFFWFFFFMKGFILINILGNNRKKHAFHHKLCSRAAIFFSKIRLNQLYWLNEASYQKKYWNKMFLLFDFLSGKVIFRPIHSLVNDLRNCALGGFRADD